MSDEEEGGGRVVALVPKVARDQAHASFILGQTMKSLEDGVAKAIVVIELRDDDEVSVNWSSGPTAMRVLGMLEIAKQAVIALKVRLK